MSSSAAAQPLQVIEDAPDSPAGSLQRSFAYFNVYRLALATVLPAAALLVSEPAGQLVRDRALFGAVSALYWAAALGFLLTHRQRWLSYNQLLTFQVVTDILALTLLMRASGGHPSGLAILIVVTLAGAGLLGQGRLAVFYAAVATLAILFEQALRVFELGAAAGEFLAVGTTSIGFFATAISARLLAERVNANEQLARQRGAALRNQMEVNEQIIRDMVDGVLVVAPGGTLRQFNPQAEQLLGRPLAAGMAISEVSVELDRALAGRTDSEPGTSGDPLTLGDNLRVRALRATRGGDALVYVEDLTTAQMQARQVKLAALGRLTANIAHEIRNPLAAISHAAELLREEKRTDMQARLTRIIHDNSRRLDRMVKEILELGRRDRIEPELIPARGFVSTFVEEFCMHESARRELFQVDVQPPEATLCFDRAHLNQVFWNLLGNAVRHCSGADGAIRILGRPHPRNRRFDLRVVDDGPGIEPAARAQVFEPFFTTHPQGTGLGLYIARELCDANRASLELLDNDPGAHFRILAQSERP